MWTTKQLIEKSAAYPDDTEVRLSIIDQNDKLVPELILDEVIEDSYTVNKDGTGDKTDIVVLQAHLSNPDGN